MPGSVLDRGAEPQRGEQRWPHSGFSTSVNLADDIDERLQCLSTDVYGTLAALTSSGSSVFALASAASTEPEYCDPDQGGFFCIEGRCGCVHHLDLILSSADVSAGRTSVRIMGKAVGLGGTLPVSVSVATTDCIDEIPQ